MSLITFMEDLAESSTVRVAAPPARGADDRAEIDGQIARIDAAARAELAFDAPALLADVARWGFELLYAACQCLAYREMDGDDVRAALSRPCPAAPSPEAHYSADLALRHLPDVYALAKGVSEQDPLVVQLLTIARAWPLSSVGMPKIGNADPSGFVRHPSLRRLYADRVIERNDASRLNDPTAASAVREAIGDFTSLAPGSLVAALNSAGASS